jgi:hypothetical protein
MLKSELEKHENDFKCLEQGNRIRFEEEIAQ